MKVNNSVNQGLKNIENSKVDRAKGDEQKNLNSDKIGKSKTLEGSSKLNLSERAQMMSKANDIASNTSVNEAKVARLQKLIDQGKYQVNAEAVADKLVDEHLKMT